MEIKEAKTEELLKNYLHDLHSTYSETMEPKTTKYIGGGESISTELSDEEMRKEMGSDLNQDDRLTKEELRIATIEGAIPTMIAVS